MKNEKSFEDIIERICEIRKDIDEFPRIPLDARENMLDLADRLVEMCEEVEFPESDDDYDEVDEESSDDDL